MFLVILGYYEVLNTILKWILKCGRTAVWKPFFSGLGQQYIHYQYYCFNTV